MTSLIQPLFEGPIDIVGDVHGEFDALRALLHRLGYDTNGIHPRGRRLVFVGDLCDRGPDSPGVIAFVRALVEQEKAQCIIGNHELNLLRGEHKHGNHWYYGDADPKHEAEFGPCRLASSSEAADMASFLKTLPLALEHSALRVVHAAWDARSIDACRRWSGDVGSAFETFEAEARSDEWHRLKSARDEEKSLHAAVLKDPGWAAPRPLEALAAYDEYAQVSNPVRVLTSGIERPTATPFFAGGQWRFVERVRWWRDYGEPPRVVFGHYWRWWDPAVQKALSKGEPYLFADEPPAGWHRNQAGAEVAFCADYSAGVRYRERKKGGLAPFHGRLAAMRWPERTVVFDDEAANGVTH